MRRICLIADPRVINPNGRGQGGLFAQRVGAAESDAKMSRMAVVVRTGNGRGKSDRTFALVSVLSDIRLKVKLGTFINAITTVPDKLVNIDV